MIDFFINGMRILAITEGWAKCFDKKNEDDYDDSESTDIDLSEEYRDIEKISKGIKDAHDEYTKKTQKLLDMLEERFKS